MALAKMLLESAGSYGTYGGFGSPSMSQAALNKYSAEYGDQLIAMESMRDAQEIFESLFYDVEVAEFRSIMEGTVVTEGIGDTIKSGIAKVKDSLKKLWEKVKAWLHNIKRYFDALFMNAADFARKYEKELKDIKLVDFEYPMYTWTLDKIYKTGDAEAIQKKVDDVVHHVESENYGNTDFSASSRASGFANTYNTRKKYTEGDNDRKITGDTAQDIELNDAMKDEILKDYATTIGLTGSISDTDELREALWSAARNGETYESKPDTVKVSSLNSYVDMLKKSTDVLSAIDRHERTITKMFGAALKKLESIENTAKDEAAKKDKIGEGAAKMQNMLASLARLIYHSVSYQQSLFNIHISEIRSAKNEQIKQTKAMIMKAMAYKNPKK